MNIVDNASTYLQAWALDFSYLGIYFANLLIGIGCGWLAARAYPRKILILAIFLTSLSLLFFSDMFFLLSTVIQLPLQVLVQKRCFRWQIPRDIFPMKRVEPLSGPTPSPLQATAVIVLYGMAPEASPHSAVWSKRAQIFPRTKPTSSSSFGTTAHRHNAARISGRR